MTLYAPKLVHEVDPEESTIPTEIGEEIDLGVSAIGQGEVLATPLEMASVAQTVSVGATNYRLNLTSAAATVSQAAGDPATSAWLTQEYQTLLGRAPGTDQHTAF